VPWAANADEWFGTPAESATLPGHVIQRSADDADSSAWLLGSQTNA
jgi:hypothetical protein